MFPSPLILPASWFAEPVAVETYAGQGGYGDSFNEPVMVLGHLSAGVRVASSDSGDEVVSQRRLLLPNPTRLADGSGEVDPRLILTAESRVYEGEQVATVVQVEEHRQPGTGAVIYMSGVLG